MTNILFKMLATNLILIAVVGIMVTAIKERSQGKSGTLLYVADLCFMALIGILPILMISLLWSL